MMRSMFASVSGLKSHQTMMDVIGNNISNVNTIGYRASRVTFKEVFNETLRGAGAPDSATGRGGTNPMQIGLGTGVGSVDTITTRGSLQRTENPTDLSIEGDGFFIVRGGDGDTYKFTRAGDFIIDKLGNMVTSGGLNVYGWHQYTRDPNSGEYIFDTERDIEPINLFSDEYNKNKRIIAAKSTENIELSGNLDASLKADAAGPYQFTVPVFVYDSLGNEYKINVQFRKNIVNAGDPSASPPTQPTTVWDWKIDDIDGGGGVQDGQLTFDHEGNIILDGSEKSVLTFIPSADVGAGSFNATIDFSKLTMFAGDSSVKPTFTDGYPTGSLVSFNIGADGVISGIYSNGRQQPLGLIAMAAFENPAGLMRAGDNTYTPTTNSGDFKRALKAGSEGVGTINPGTLEMSNVDLAKQFTDMIVTQRGFQANSRIITTTDEMLQELANIKR
ncbi:MAG: flagellar hook protein FlgE [Acetivibrionales bacterium]|jgi:flagellar hook protein FlgE